MKNWENYIIEQKEICKRLNVNWIDSEKELKIGLSEYVLTDLFPINGMRHIKERGTCGWYIWSGTEYSEKEDFFKPYCVEHLITLKPEIIKYLGLPPGYRFLIDNEGYEDMWMDENLIK